MPVSRWRWLVGAGVLAFFFFLLVQAPAALVGRVLAAYDVRASGFHGTLWSGEARVIQAGNLRFEDVRWRTKPAALLLARLTAEVAGKLPDGFLSGTVTLGAGGSLRFTELQAAAPLAAFAANARPDSQISLRMDEFAFDDGWVTAARGTARLANIILALPGATGRAAAGQFELSFDDPEVGPGEPLIGQITDSGGPLELAGTVTLTPPRNYELSGLARTRPGAPSSLSQALAMSGPADGEGRHTISLAGSF